MIRFDTKKDYEFYNSKLEENAKLQQENKKLKMINEEYERLNKNKYRGFKIINKMQELEQGSDSDE
jgi:hypothetical protein